MSEDLAAAQSIFDDWAQSLVSFAMAFDIKNKKAKVVPFEVSVPQNTVFDDLQKHRRLMFLKGRQMWITTAVSIFVFWLCWSQPGVHCAVCLQSDRSAIRMGKTYMELFRGNRLLMHAMGIKSESSHLVEFTNGSKIFFDTANSDVLRSTRLNFVHASECSIYDDLGEFLAAALVADDGWKVLETTASGDGEFYKMWLDETSQFIKRFLCWRDHLEYRDPRPIEGRLQQVELDYIALHQLRPDEANWWVRFYRGLPPDKRHLAMQEMPSTWQEAFLHSGDGFLRRKVPVIPAEMQKSIDGFGICRIHPYDPTHKYAAGGDMGEGSQDGDPTTLTILDLTLHAVAATMQLVIPAAEYKPLARWLLWEYGDPVTAIETAFGGIDVSDYLRQERKLPNMKTGEMVSLPGVPMYQMVSYGGIAPELLPRYGWRTDEISRAYLFGGIYDGSILENKWEIGCHRTVMELNSLVYRGKPLKPQAPKNQHDDLAVSFGLSLQAVTQARPPRQVPVAAAKSRLEEFEEQLAHQSLDKQAFKSLPGDDFDSVFLS